MTSGSFRRISFLLGILTLAPLFLDAAERKVKSAVKAVTVFSDRALIVRRAEEQLSAGEHTLLFADLPVQLQDQSVRVSGSAEGGARILDVNISTAFLDTIPEQRIRDLQDRLRVLRAEQQTLNDRLSVLNSQKLFIDSLRASFSRDARGTSGQRGFDEWERMLAFLEKNLTSIFGKVQETQQKLSTVRDRIAAVEKEIQNSQAYSRRSQKRITVLVRTDRAGTLNLDLSYVLGGAGWVPLYEARVSTESKQIEFTYAAQVRQGTNEDWSNIELTLSTARPAAGGAAPSLSPWFVDALQPVPMPPLQQGMGFKSRVATPEDKVARSEITMEALELEVAQVEAQATSVIFKLPSKANIPSDNNPHRVTVSVERLPAEFSYAITPKYAQAAFMTAKAKNATDYPFLPGAMNIFFENNFVATSHLGTVLPGEEFRAGLGTDEGIRVERKLLNRFTEYTGTFTSKKKLIYEFLMKVENTKRITVDLLLQDQVPLSRNEKIVVEVLSPTKELKPDEQGFLKWNLSLKPGEKKEVRLKFSVEFPADMNVSGLD